MYILMGRLKTLQIVDLGTALIPMAFKEIN